MNPVLREGNSDRRAPAAVKNYARKHPHSMGEWSADSKTQVATMGRDDFRSNEQSVIMPEADSLRIQLVDSAGEVSVLKDDLKVLQGEVVDATVLRAASLDAFLREQVERAKELGVLFSVHLKATMMKVSDPIIFGHVIKAFLPEVFDKYGDDLAAAGLSANDGLGAILAGLDKVANGAEIKAAIEQGLADGPDDCRRVVRRQLRIGARVIKVCASGGVMSQVDHPIHQQFTAERHGKTAGFPLWIHV